MKGCIEYALRETTEDCLRVDHISLVSRCIMLCSVSGKKTGRTGENDVLSRRWKGSLRPQGAYFGYALRPFLL